MIVRIWTTGIILGKKHEYLKFAKIYSIPMFKKQKGILGVNIFVKDDKSLVLTYWNDKKEIDAMENDLLYNQTVDKIRNAGFLSETQQVEIFDASIQIEDLNKK